MNTLQLINCYKLILATCFIKPQLLLLLCFCNGYVLLEIPAFHAVMPLNADLGFEQMLRVSSYNSKFRWRKMSKRSNV